MILHIHYLANLTMEQLGDVCWFRASRLAAQGKGRCKGPAPSWRGLRTGSRAVV